MSGQLPMFGPMTSEVLPSAISSPASGAGVTPSASPAGSTTDLSGPALAPASHFRPRTSGMVVAPVEPIDGIFGHPGAGSLSSAGLQRCLASRLRQRLGTVGSTKLSATWSVFHTPAGRQYCQRAASELVIFGGVSGSWPTPAARDGKDVSRSNAFLSQRLRHSPSMATRWLSLGRPWQVITAVYCLAMGYPSSWNETRLKAMATPSSRKSRKPSSRPISRPEDD